VGEAAAAAVAAWAVATPLVMLHFGIVSPLGPAATLLLMPLVVVVLSLGYAALLVGAIVQPLAGLMGSGLVWLGMGVTWIVFVMDGLPGAVLFVPRVSEAWVVAATVVIVWWIVRGSWRDWRTVSASAVVVVWLVLQWMGTGVGRDAALRMDALDVSQGTCMLVRSGDEAMLWDCGSLRMTVGERLVPNAVRELGSGRVRRVVLSHPNIDHYSGLVDALAPLGVREVMVGEGFVRAAEEDGDGPAALLLEEVRRRGVAVRVVRAGETFSFGEARATVVWPDSIEGLETVNDTSLVMRIEVVTAGGPRRVLLTGDIQRDAMRRMMAGEVDIAADVMEAPHHGSAIAASYAFVERGDPGVVIQSTDRSRLDDARWDEVRAGRMWLATAGVGAVSVVIERDGTVAADGFIDE
ncbi:MAG: ComEC/Rec2 family competence protein, partial [Planctomycetota bacterium]|nr:ComEC/Rec2 family competence protein [Planctomycetota bacterium]